MILMVLVKAITIGASAENVGRTHQNREANLLGGFDASSGEVTIAPGACGM